MTDQSRVEAVARAVDSYLWSEIDKPKGTRYYHPDVRDDIDYDTARKSSLLRAKIAIDASDAWMAEQGVVALVYTCGKCGHLKDNSVLASRAPCTMECGGTMTLSFERAG